MALDDVSKLGGFKNRNTEKPLQDCNNWSVDWIQTLNHSYLQKKLKLHRKTLKHRNKFTFITYMRFEECIFWHKISELRCSKGEFSSRMDYKYFHRWVSMSNVTGLIYIC